MNLLHVKLFRTVMLSLHQYMTDRIHTYEKQRIIDLHFLSFFFE